MTLKKMNERSPKETIKVAGYQKEDATRYQKPWEDQPYQFLVYPSTSPRRERLYLPLSTRSSNPHPHDAQPILPQGRQAKGGNTKDKRDLSKGWQRTTTSQEQATNFPKSEAKGREASSPRNTSCLSKATQPLWVALNRWHQKSVPPGTFIKI